MLSSSYGMWSFHTLHLGCTLSSHQVARRRLKRPPRRSAHLAPHRARLTLAQAAGIDRIAPRVDQDAAVMRDQIRSEDDRDPNIDAQGDDDDPDTEVEGEPSPGHKVAGE